MMRGRTLAAAGAALALITGAGVAYAATTAQTATCTASPTITDGETTQSIDVTCSWPKPPAVTTTATVTSTVTVTATGAPSSTTTTTASASSPPTTSPSSEPSQPPAPTSSTTTTTPSSTSTTTPTSSAFPDASNTGVPAGTTLTASGGLTITTAGTVVDGRNITGTVSIRANNVTIRNSRISGSGFHIVTIADNVTGARLENVEIDGRGRAGTAGSTGVYGRVTMIRANVYGVENGAQPSAGSVIRDSWFHGLAAPGSPHIDGIQIDGARSNILLEHNTVDMREWTQTAAVMIDNYFGPVDNVTVNNNRLLGGGYTVYSDARFGTNSCDGKPCGGAGGAITNVAFTSNRIGGGYWGHASIDRNTPVWTGNVDDKTGATIPQP